jgi:3-phosphoshikimate 1-carboxyvinyltransferase
MTFQRINYQTMIKINPTQIDGQVYAPSSKSEFQRILALSSLSDKISHISYTSKCNDVNAAIEIIKKLGCDVTEETGKITIKANEKVKKSSFHCGESGLLARMFAPIGTLLCDKLTIEGEGSLLNRNMDMVGDALSQLDASVIGNKLPISINGPLVGGKNITIDGSSSSQLLTGLLIALPFLDVVNTIVNVKNPTSIPYIDLTLSTLQKVGVTIHNDNYNYNYIQFIIPGRQKIQSVNTTIEGDWSGAAFFFSCRRYCWEYIC